MCCLQLYARDSNWAAPQRNKATPRYNQAGSHEWPPTAMCAKSTTPRLSSSCAACHSPKISLVCQHSHALGPPARLLNYNTHVLHQLGLMPAKLPLPYFKGWQGLAQNPWSNTRLACTLGKLTILSHNQKSADSKNTCQASTSALHDSHVCNRHGPLRAGVGGLGTTAALSHWAHKGYT